MDWADEKTIRLGETEFQIIENVFEMFAIESTGQRFLLGKLRPMVDWYEELLRPMERPRVFELGIFKGGSAAFFHALCPPHKLVAIEYEKKRVEALDEYIQAQDCADTLVPYYGVNQADTKELNKILDREFPGEELDVVIDDASHFLKETRTSFNVLFPRLRVGGLYVIEDWGWAHCTSDLVQKRRGLWNKQPALSILIFEILMAMASDLNLIESIRVTGQMAVITRGKTPINGPFDISKCYATRGRRFKPGI